MAQYLKPDSELGYIEDNAEIEFLKFNNLRHTILGCMLGDFDERGAYVVSPEITKELISMEKYIVQTYDNIELCKSALRLDKQISFMVTFEGNKATLSLVEKLSYEANFTLNSGTYSNINEYVLDSVETSGEVNRNMIYARWNIKMVPSNIIDIFNCDESVLEKYFGLVNRFKYLLKANTLMLQKESQIEDIEASYSNSLLEVLKHYPALNKEVMDNIAEDLKVKKDSISVNKPYFAKTFNELLENAISKHISTLSEKEQVEFNQEKRNAMVALNVKRQDVFELEQVETGNDEEVSLKAYQVKQNQDYHSKSLLDLAQDLVRENKSVTMRVSGGENVQYESALFRRTILAVSEKKGNLDDLPEEIKNSPEEFGEREKLIESLVKAGLGELINKTKKEQSKLEDKTTKQEKSVKAEVKKSTTNKKAETKAKKPTAAKKSSAKKAAKKKKEEKGKKTDKEETKPEKTRLLAESYFAKNVETDKSAKETKPNEDITILTNAELENINRKINKEVVSSAKTPQPKDDKVETDVKVVEVDVSVKVENSGTVKLLDAETARKPNVAKRATTNTTNAELENTEELNNIDTI